MPEHRQDRADNNASVIDSGDPYITSDLEIASFLVASDYLLEHAEPQPNGKIVQFYFPSDARNALREYFRGASLPARDLFRAHRDLRHTCKQVKIHNGGTSRVNQSR